MFSAGMTRDSDEKRLKLSQLAIYRMQKTLERSFTDLSQADLLLCDRGTLDGLAYWPGTETDYFHSHKSNLQDELNRYHAVIFFETSAASGDAIKSNNPFRTENSEQSIILDKKLQDIWSKHPNYHFVPNNTSFMKKINLGIMTINKVLTDAGQDFDHIV
jgi:hypothetical protein